MLKRILIIATAVLAYSSSAQAQFLNDGLLNYWTLDTDATDSAGSIAGSASSTNDDGTVVGDVGTVTNLTAGGLFGGAYDFEHDAYIATWGGIDVPDAGAAGAIANDTDRSGVDMSASVWVQFDNNRAQWQALMAHGEGSDWRLARENNNNWNVACNLGGNNNDVQSDQDPPPTLDDTNGLSNNTGGVSGWHNLVVTVDVANETKSVYWDGQLVGQKTADAGLIAENGQNKLRIGGNPDNPARQWDGLVDDVAMWDRPLSAADVQNIYDAGANGKSLATLIAEQNTDTDNDGLSDPWEIANLGAGAENDNGLNPNNNGIPGNPDFGADGDPDMDTLTNTVEQTRGTHPNKDDTDEDGYNDKVETNDGTFDDILTDTGTDPLDDDTDNDGLLDGVETNTGIFVDAATDTGTDPLSAHSDTDTMPDGYEVANMLDPFIDDSNADPDTDDSNNVTEYNRGTLPQDDDTDDDGFKDGHEDGGGVFVSATMTGTDPLNDDTDGDGLLDGVETNDGSFDDPATDTGSNPHLIDTDSDGANDGWESVAEGRDPNVADALNSGGIGDELLAYWTFDNTLADIAHSLPTESAVADDGVFAGPDTDVGYAATGLFGSSALEQNGEAGYVSVAPSVDTLRGVEDEVSISAWLKVTTFDTNWQALVAHGEGNQYRIARHDANNSMAYAGGVGDIFGDPVGEPAVDDGNWHHVAAITSKAAGYTKLYIDGTEIATGGAPDINDLGNSADTIPNLHIGGNPQAGGREWEGLIDDVAIWGRAITVDEIAAIYAGGAGASIESLLTPQAPFAITVIDYDSVNDTFTLTWSSQVGREYSIFASQDAINWGEEVHDSEPGAAGTTSYGPFANPFTLNPGEVNEVRPDVILLRVEDTTP